jgi:hypothetical protein
MERSGFSSKLWSRDVGSKLYADGTNNGNAGLVKFAGQFFIFNSLNVQWPG